MALDTKLVKEIFLEAAELSEETARAGYLDKACGGDAGLRKRIEALLRAHDPEGSFLGTPAAVVPEPDDGAIHDPTPAPDHAATRTRDGGAGVSGDQTLTFLAPSTRPDALGRIGHYEVLQVLGRGGFGIVFRAFDEMLQRMVALKVLDPQLAATSPAPKHFLREARSSAQVRHENVVQVYEVAEQPLPYLVMEFIPGETLQQKLDRVGPLDVLEVLRIGRQIAEGLAAAHAMDLIHRDIKPGNVLLEGGHQKVKITDFGLARTVDDAGISQSDIIAGTPIYMAPEQARGLTLDPRSDLFSLGSVLYQMVTGRPPFRANSAVAVLKRVAEDQPRAIREIIPETPQWLCDIITKLHAKNPDNRYQSAREVADLFADCEAQLKANARLKDYSRIPRSKPRRPRRRKWVVVAVVVLLPVLALALTEITGVTHLFRDREPRPAANASFNPKEVQEVSANANVQHIAALPIAEQVEEVRKEMMRHNLGFDGQMGHKIEGDVVTELRIVTDKVADLTPLEGMNWASLTRLNLPDTKVTDAGMVYFKDSKDLRYLDLSRTKVTDRGMAHFKGCKKLIELYAIGTQLSDAGLVHFQDCKALTHLNLTSTQVSGVGLVHFKDCKDLTFLHLEYTQVGDVGLAHFKDCKNLSTLDLAFTRVSDVGLAYFKDCKKLSWLVLTETKVSAAGLAHFKGMPLRVLWIYNTGITDLTPLQDMPLEDIRLTPKNITHGLDILRAMKSLKTIGIDWSQAWPAAEFWQRYDKGEFK
jgi:serine/threonine protein kinase/uncharacterized membrane protein